MDLDDDELKATRKLHGLMYKNVKIKKYNETEEVLNEMAHDILHGRQKYLINVFNENQVIDCYKRKVKRDSDWYIGK